MHGPAAGGNWWMDVSEFKKTKPSNRKKCAQLYVYILNIEFLHSASKKMRATTKQHHRRFNQTPLAAVLKSPEGQRGCAWQL